MNTQMPILNVNSPKAAALPTSQAESLTAEVPFNQMLSKEVSNRNAAASSPAPAPTPAASSNNDSQAQNRVQNQSKPAEASKENTQDTAKSSTATAAAGTAAASSNAQNTDAAKAKDSKDADQAKKDDEHQENDVSTPASAQMLALVAGVGQLNQANQAQQPVARHAAGEDMDALTGQKGGKKAIGQIAHNDKHDPLDLKGEAEAGAHGKKEKGELLALGGALEGKQVLGKDGAEGKAGPTRGIAGGDKSAGEAGLLSKNALASGAGTDASALTQTQGKFVLPEPKQLKTGEVLTPQQAAAAAVVAPGVQQTMSLNQQAAVSGQAVERLTPPVGSQGWDQAVGQKVVWMASGGIQSASLTLNPPDLGPLQVVLHVNNDQADATFITAQPEVKQALEAAMPKLREMMDQAGIQLSQATVNTGMPNQQQGAQQQQLAQNGGSRSGGNGSGKDDGELHVSTVPVRPAARGGLGLVDTFA